MKIIFKEFLSKTNNLDKFLITLIFLFPLLLCVSIFFADLFASISALLVIGLFFSKKNRKIFLQIRYETYYFLIFYFLILISLFFSTSFKESFLPSFFYFRYFLFIMGIYYLFQKYTFFKNIFFYSLIFTLSILIFDALIQLTTGFNIFGYPKGSDPTPFITSFFNDEKKFGSYLVRLLPMLLSLLYFLNYNKFSKYVFFIIGFFIFYSSERTALFLFFVTVISYIFIIKNKIKFFLISLFIISIFFSFNEKLKYKYVDYTLQQLGFLETKWNKDHIEKKRYFSKEHEDLSLTALVIFKDNIFNGSGIKTFYQTCNFYKLQEKEKKISYLDFLNRQNKITCSTHPHNLYLQILSEIGIFGFLMLFFIFLKVLSENIKIFFRKVYDNISISYYLLNVGIIINLFPLIPYGNFFNNWLSLIIFYPLGFWFFINQKYRRIIYK